MFKNTFEKKNFTLTVEYRVPLVHSFGELRWMERVSDPSLKKENN